MSDQLPLPTTSGRSTKIVLVDPKSVRISPLNPRLNTPHAPDTIARLAAELKAAGQINDAHGEPSADGIIEILAGSRRCAACTMADMQLRVRIHADLSREDAIAIAYRDDREAITPSLWDLAGGWSSLLTNGIVKTDAALASLVGVDKSTMSRGLAFRNAPEQILAAFSDRREISLTQWMALAPLLEDETLRAKVIERAALITGKGYPAPRVASELKAAAAGKIEIKALEVRNRHDRIIATIQPGHRGDFTIKVKSLLETHPSHRIEYAKLLHDRFSDVLKSWFDRDA